MPRPEAKRSEPTIDPVSELSLGQRQPEMVEVLGATDELGLTTSCVCELMGGYDTANGHVALRRGRLCPF